ncbi:phospholipase A2 group XV [Sergentomyia squamirostris]
MLLFQRGLRISLILGLLLIVCAESGEGFFRFPGRRYRGDPTKRSPIVFIPGDGGSQVDAKLDKPEVVHYICQKHTNDFFNIWLNMELLVPLVIDCWIDNVKLYYDNVTRTTSNSPGVITRIPGWGHPETVEWLDPSHASAGAYFKDIGNALVSIGYERNVSIRGAPYDFRKAPNENTQWFVDLKTLIEETYTLNDKQPVTLVAHSMGGPMSLIFLQQQTREWKSKYIARMVTLAGAWAGSAKAVKVFAIGDDLGSFALSGKTMRAEQITSPSLAWLMPSPLFWKPDEILVQTQSRAYTMKQLEEFFNDLQYRTGWEMMQDTMKYMMNFSPPDVEVHSLYGTNISTVEKLYYRKSKNLDGTPELINGDGDGTVNLRSLQASTQWRDLQKQKVYTMELPGVDHMAILSDSRVIKYIIDLLIN